MSIGSCLTEIGFLLTFYIFFLLYLLISMYKCIITYTSILLHSKMLETVLCTASLLVEEILRKTAVAVQ